VVDLTELAVVLAEDGRNGVAVGVGEAGVVEGIDEVLGRRGERDVQALGHRLVVGGDREVAPFVAGPPQVEHGEDGVVEAS
jgi:hypothetical protein